MSAYATSRKSLQVFENVPEWNRFMIPTSEDTIDELEMELTYEFNAMGISCSYEVNIV